MIKTSALLSEVNRIKAVMPGVVYDDRAQEITGFGMNTAGCRYTLNNRPGCIVGLALANLGVDINRLEEYDDNNGDGSSIGEIISDFGDDFEVDSYDTVLALGKIQNHQDQGAPWGECG